MLHFLYFFEMFTIFVYLISNNKLINLKIKYVHTNITASDWKKLSGFYIDVFDCKPLLPRRDQKGKWLDKGTGVNNAHIEGMHLQLPGFDETGPTLEIYEYSKIIRSERSHANKQGYGHIAFHTDKIEFVLKKALDKGASQVGEMSQQFIDGVGMLTFIYISDPEGYLIELQNWS